MQNYWPHRPIRNPEKQEYLCRDLEKEPTDDSISYRNLVNIPPLEFGEERFHVLQRRALSVTEAEPLINANGREWKRIKKGCFTVVHRERESPPSSLLIRVHWRFSFGASEATICSKRGSPRSESQKGSSFSAP